MCWAINSSKRNLWREEEDGCELGYDGVVISQKIDKDNILTTNNKDDVVSSKEKRRKICVYRKKKSHKMSTLEVHSQLL